MAWRIVGALKTKRFLWASPDNWLPLSKMSRSSSSADACISCNQFGSTQITITSPNDPRLFHSSPSSCTEAHPTSSASAVEGQIVGDASVEVQTAEEEDGAVDILRTENGQTLYSTTSSSELLRTLFNLQLVAFEPIVDASIAILKSPLMNPPSFFRWSPSPILWVLKRTAYQHFCAGENVAEATRTLQKLREKGLQGILNYSLEDAIDNIHCDHNLAEFLNTISITPHLPHASVSSGCVKITAIAPVQLLERVSDLLRWQHAAGRSRFPLPWMEDSLPFLSKESPIYHVGSEPPSLTSQEESDLRLAHQRLDQLCKACEDVDLPLLVDAEYSSVQPAIDYLTYAMALTYNDSKRRHGSRPLIFPTIQAYLKDAMPRLSLARDEASKRGIAFGVKLVRGAYLTREKELAASLGAPSPIHSTIQETHVCYNSCAEMMLEHASAGKGAVLLATHNYQSGKAAASKAQELGLRRGDARLQFAQLKGMADGLSLSLSQAGFRVSKYLPFGPVEEVIPYLIRRAEENRALVGNTVADRKCIRKELRRRLFAAMGL